MAEDTGELTKVRVRVDKSLERQYTVTLTFNGLMGNHILEAIQKGFMDSRKLRDNSNLSFWINARKGAAHTFNEFLKQMKNQNGLV